MKKIIITSFVSLINLIADAIPLSNPHPFILNHFMPVLEGKNDRVEIFMRETSYFDTNRVIINNIPHELNMDFEATEITIFSKHSFKYLSLSARIKYTYLHDGFFDIPINKFHSETGFGGGDYNTRKNAPINKFNYSLINLETNKELLKNSEHISFLELYLSTKDYNGYIGRFGIRFPSQLTSNLYFQKKSEYSFTIQKSGKIWNIDYLVDLSAVKLKKDDIGIEVNNYRYISNLELDYKNFFTTFNFTTPIYKNAGDELNSNSAVVSFGYKYKNFTFGFTEDLTRYLTPDISLFIGYSY